MPEFPSFTLNIPVLGNTWALGAAFQIHLVIVAFIMGIAIVAPVAESLGQRDGGRHEEWEWLARRLGSTIVRFFAFGATWAVFSLVLVYGLYPRLFGVLTSIFFWPFIIVSGIWLVMTVSSYMYYETWDRLAQHKGWHIAIGWVFAGSAFIFISLITGLSSYQLTPITPAPGQLPYANASWPTEIIHRHIGNLSYAGLLLAGYSALRVLSSPADSVERARFDWLGHMGLLLGAGLAVLQPIVGWFYSRQIELASADAYQRMMLGENAWMFLVQMFFIGVVLFSGNYYLATAMRRGNPGPGVLDWARNSLWAIGVLALLGIVPKELPLGQMMPWKYISLLGIGLLTIVNLTLYLRAEADFAWGRVSRGSQAALVVVGVAIVALMVTMGVIRESARGSDLIYKRMPASQSQEIPSP
ncbi:MAG: hypothetical protein M1531_05545 [Chloroflexi bacterium]|nr:hypothetical protein [Chloroflexota bacterium]